MKRDMDLVRFLLLTIESSSERLTASEIQLEGYDSAAIVYHANLLRDAGLIDATDCGTRACRDDKTIWRLTWSGHEFLDAARSDRTWEAVKREVRTRIVSIPFDALQSLLTQLASRAMGQADWPALLTGGAGQ